MSYGIMAYLVDTNELLNLLNVQQKKRSILSVIFSKKDEKDKILFGFKSELDDLDESIREVMDEEDELFEVSLSRKVLDEFLSNNISNYYEGYIYGYVFKMLCEYKGVFLDNSEWYPCSSDSHCSIPFTTPILPIKFPIPDDWPSIDYINHTDLNLKNAQYNNMDDAQKERLVDWFTQAVNSKKDIYLFYH